MTGASPQRKFLPEDEPLPPLDRALAVDWHADVEWLYRGHAAGLIRHFTGQTKDPERATDIVHEAFSRFAEVSAVTRDSLKRPDSYLFRICLNLFRDQSRKEAGHRRHEADLHVNEPPFDPVVQLESRDTLRRLETAMLRLKPKTRAIFIARRVDGMGYAEIAERTGLSVRGVEKQMAKAIEILDRLMERDRP